MNPSNLLSRRLFLGSTSGLALGGGFALTNRPILGQIDPGNALTPQKQNNLIDFLEKEQKSGAVPGAAIVASKNGKTVFEHYTGTYHNSLGEEKPYRPGVHSTFYSYSKGISATVVMIAHQEGLIDIDEPVIKSLPEFGTSGKEKITIRHLLTHSAGIPSAPTPFKPVRTEEEWKSTIQAMCQAKPEWAPGSRTAYHAFAMLIPAEIIRRKSDRKTWDAHCREKLFDPIGAKTLTFGTPKDPTLLTWAPKGTNGSDQIQNQLPGHPAGGCSGTLDDALKVLQLHLNQGQWNHKTLLGSKAFQEMHTVQYQKEIDQAVAQKKPPVHEPWAVGWLMRGDGKSPGASSWFGFRDQKNQQIFGHAGIDTIIGVADPASQVALLFNTTRSPKSSEETTRLRNEASNRVLAALT